MASLFEFVGNAARREILANPPGGEASRLMHNPDTMNLSQRIGRFPEDLLNSIFPAFPRRPHQFHDFQHGHDDPPSDATDIPFSMPIVITYGSATDQPVWPNLPLVRLLPENCRTGSSTNC